MRAAGGKWSLPLAFVALASACGSRDATAPTHERDADLSDVLADASLVPISPPREGGGDSAQVDAEVRDSSALMPVDEAGRDGGTLDSAGTIDAGGSDANSVEPLSCAVGGSGMTNCGSAGNGTESCCTSLGVTGGTFYRSFDGVTYTDKSHPATISDFRLDKYEITVGRFRQFVTAIVAGWRPALGSGKHTHLNGGKGLSTTANGHETGWDASWDSLFPTTLADWTSKLVVAQGTWTSSVSANENKPISNQSWYDAYAFCIWDGGFLPSEAEWNYAAAGGGGATGQRVYPWSNPPTSTAVDCAHANYAHEQPGTGTPACTSPSCVGGCPTTAPNNVGSESPLGDGAYGQTDMSGNIQEWMLDLYGLYVTPCIDCVNLAAASGRAFHGGGWSADSTRDGNLRISYRLNFAPTSRFNDMGARCARRP
jgi:formylglycine-generating enzyme required for sulfatase activity